MKTIEQKVLKFIDRYSLIEPGDKLLIALSGGPDSVFALYFFKKYERRFKSEIFAAHVNHQLRGAEADEDEKFCKRLCDNLGIKFFSDKVDVKNYAKSNKLSLEEAARVLRYSYLMEVADNSGSNKIITAHNMNDNAETVLLNLFKGTGIAGVSGIPIKRHNIIRPLLNLCKDDILNYLNKKNIQYRIDSTNLENDFSRNFIRNEIIPLIKDRINPSLEETLFKSSRVFKSNFQILDKYIKQILDEFVDFNKGQLKINLSLIKQFDKEILNEVFKKSLEVFFNYEYSFNDSTKLLNLINKQVGRNINLTNGLVAFRERGCILIQKPDPKTNNTEYKVKIGERIKFGDGFLESKLIGDFDFKHSYSKKSEYISADDLDLEFTLRKWKFGDRFIPLGMKGFKKVSDFLNEQKVSASKKKDQFVLLNRNNIVWVVGLRIDDRYKVLPSTKRICKLWMN